MRDELKHYGIPGQKKGVRRWQNADGSFNEEGKIRYGRVSKTARATLKRIGKVAVVAALATIGYHVFREQYYAKLWKESDGMFDDVYKVYNRVKIAKDKNGNKIDPIILNAAICNAVLKNFRDFNTSRSMPNRRETKNRILREYEGYFRGEA